MAENGQIKSFFNNLMANATWDFLKAILGAGMFALGIGLWRYLRHRPVDWWGLLGLGVFVCIIFVVLLSFRHHPEKQTEHRETSVARDATGNWKPKWKKLQWANSQRERLERENAGLQNEVQQPKEKLESSQPPTFVFVNLKVWVDQPSISRGKTLTIRYLIRSSKDVSDDIGPEKIWLGASLPNFSKPSQDKVIFLRKGEYEYTRELTVPGDYPLGPKMLYANVWWGIPANGTKSEIIAPGEPRKIEVT